MLHGANEGAWCFDKFRPVFESLGWTCHAPDPIGHGARAKDAAKTLVGIGMDEYRAELEAFLKTISPLPVLLGHSMGAVLAQLLGAKGLPARSCWRRRRRTPASAADEAEEKLGQDLMGLGAFWNTVVNPGFQSRPRIDPEPRARERAARRVRQIRPESGRAFFELFFWMFDRTGATAVDTQSIRCPVLCLAGARRQSGVGGDCTGDGGRISGRDVF